jgi:hypothetical protein
MKHATVATFLSFALIISGEQAMEIRQFDKMAVSDQGDYVQAQVDGAQKVLKADGKADLAAKVKHLFTTKDPGDAHTIGVVEFERNLALARAADADRAVKDPNAPRLEVEHAMFVTLKKNGVILPSAFMTVASNFKPKLPTPQKK